MFCFPGRIIFIFFKTAVDASHLKSFEHFSVVKRSLTNVYGSGTADVYNTFNSQCLKGLPLKKYLESLFLCDVNTEGLNRI
jgi:hypothetical protein